MGYSLNRALPLAVLGFVVGAGFVILLRGLQQMDTLWNPQLGLVVGGVLSTVFFLWGIGGISSEMAAHHVAEPEEDEFGNELPVEDHHHHGEENPTTILSEQIWTVAFWVMIMFGVLLVFAALPGGFGYTLSSDAAANVNANGFFPVDMGGGNTLYVSKLVAFIIFAAFTMVSLFGAAWLFARGLFGLHSGIKTVKAEGNQPLQPLYTPLGAGSSVAALPSGEAAIVEAAPAPVAAAPTKPAVPPRQYNGFFDWAFASFFGAIGWVFSGIGKLIRFHVNMILDEPTPAHARSTGERAKRVLLFLVLGPILYVLFYEVAIGLVLPQPYSLRMLVSFVNVVLVLLLIFRTKWVLFIIGTGARFTAQVMRGIPAFLFQRD